MHLHVVLASFYKECSLKKRDYNNLAFEMHANKIKNKIKK
jgi:hypothetical protein